MSDVDGGTYTVHEGACIAIRLPQVITAPPTSLGALPPYLSVAILAEDIKMQFRLQGGLDRLERYVGLYRQAVESTPDDEPLQMEILNCFAGALDTRFEHLGDRADLEESIAIRETVDALTPEDSPEKPSRLINLAGSIMKRFGLEGNAQDLEAAISLSTRALSLSPDDDENRALMLSNLGLSLETRFGRTGSSEDLKKAITIQREAVDSTPDGHPGKPMFVTNLSNSLYERFSLRGDLEDLEQSIQLQNHAISITPDAHPDKAGWLSNLGNKLLKRFERLGGLEDINKSVLVSNRAVERTPDNHTLKPARLTSLANSLHARFARTGSLSDMAWALACETDAVNFTQDNHPQKPVFLVNLGNTLLVHFETFGNADELDRAIVAHSRAVELTPAGEVGLAGRLFNLARSLRVRFEKRGETADIDKAIRCGAQAVEVLPEHHPHRAWILRLLALLYRARLMSSRAPLPQDLTCVIEALSEAMQHIASPPVQRFQACGLYIMLLSEFSHLVDAPKITLLEAYELQVSLIPQCVWIGNGLNSRYASEAMPVYGPAVSSAAAAAIAAGEYVKAMEWLESGRALVWSQVLQLRTPLDELPPELAADFGRISQALQHHDARSPDATELRSHTTSIDFFTELPGPQGKSSHAHAIEYEKLIKKIRGIEGFSNFLRPKELSQLATASSSGPVVVINLHLTRCDALVLLADGQVTHLPLPKFSYNHAARLLKNLWSVLTARSLRGRCRDGSYHDHEGSDRGANLPGKGMRNDPMFRILADLWVLVVKPVINFIRTQINPRNSELLHVTWCPTGPLAFLPLHAAGIYHPDGTHSETVLDSVVSSYTPSLEALLKPRPRPTPSTEYPRVLVVSQPATPGCKPIPETTTEAAMVMSLTGQSTCTLDDADGTVDSVLEGMASHDWVHLACHGMQNRDSPAESSFALYDGKLSLSTLTSKHLPRADLAVLSACQTATGDAKVVEEAVHLAAGMLNVGYKSVIGTMWSIFDDSAPVVMAKFYEVMMEQVKKGEELQPAYALHEATKALRDKYGAKDFIRWIPFVHFGL